MISFVRWALAIFLALIAIGFAVFVRYYFTAWHNNHTSNQLRVDLGQIRHVAWEYVNRSEFPPATFSEFVTRVDPRKVRPLLSGRDPWGRKFMYRSIVGSSPNGGQSFQIKIRSFGPNGLDEQGNGDDVQVITGVYWMDLPVKEPE